MTIRCRCLLVLTLAALLAAAPLPAGADENEAPHQGKKAELLVELPEGCNTPDGMTAMPDGSLMLSVPNFNDPKGHPAVLVRVTPDRKAEIFYELPPLPDTGRAGPMGLAATPEGDIYLADNQWFDDPNYKSRLLKIVMDEKGKPKEVRTVVSGFKVANAVALQGDYVYVSETIISDTEKRPLVSGVFRFKLGQEGIVLTQPLEKDPHCIGTIETHNPKVPFGADGLAFDRKGNLYIGNFADGTVHRITFDAQGNPAGPPAIFAKDSKMRSADGMYFDKKTDRLYVADSLSNAVQVVEQDGRVWTLSQYGDSTGADGDLDQPCEVILWDGVIVSSNMDFPVPGGVNTTFDPPYTLSEIRLD